MVVWNDLSNTEWMDYPSQSNILRRTYVNGFLDVSQNIVGRKDMELKGNITINGRADYKWNSFGQVLSGVFESDNLTAFGLTVDMDASGNTIVVGAYKENTGGFLGAAYVYKYDSVSEIWYQHGPRLTPNSSINSQFGWQGAFISDDGSIVAVNDRGSNSSTTSNTSVGKVYVFQYNSSTNTWDDYGSNQSVLEGTSSNQELGHRGISMSGDGSTISGIDQLGNYGNSICRIVNGSWTQIGLMVADGTHYCHPSLNYDGSRVVLNKFSHQQTIVYEYSGSGTVWNQVGSTITNTGGNTVECHTSMNKEGNIIAVHEETNQTVRIYQYDETVTGSWKQLGTTLLDEFGSSGHFGEKMRLNAAGDMIIIGNRHDVAATIQIYKYQNDDWFRVGETIYGISNSQFGRAVAISDDGTRVVAGGYLADLNGNDSGYVQAFQWSIKAPYVDPMLNISDGVVTLGGAADDVVSNYAVNQLGNTLFGESANNHFGASAEMNKDGSIVVIGAPGFSSGTFEIGRVYVYAYRNGFWQQKGSTISPYPDTNNAGIGAGVDINNDGNVIIAGSGHDYNAAGTNLGNNGTLDVFEFINGDWVQKGSTIYGIVNHDHLGMRGLSINGAGNIIAGFFHQSGFVRVYQYDDDTSDWVQMGGDIPMTPGITTIDMFWQNRRIDLSEDGTIIALGDLEDDTAGTNNGKITIYKYTVVDSVGSWNKLGDDIVSPNGATAATEAFGASVSLSSDGHTVAFSSRYWNGNKGLARIFKYSEEGNVWTQLGADFNVTTVTNDSGTQIARTVGLSGDGKTFIHGESNNDTYGSDYGAIHIHKYFNGQWNQIHTEFGIIDDHLGINGVGMSRDGTRFVASSATADTGGTDIGFSSMFEISKNTGFKINRNGNVETIETDASIKAGSSITAGTNLDTGSTINAGGGIYMGTSVWNHGGGGAGVAARTHHLYFNTGSNSRHPAILATGAYVGFQWGSGGSYATKAAIGNGGFGTFTGQHRVCIKDVGLSDIPVVKHDIASNELNEDGETIIDAWENEAVDNDYIGRIVCANQNKFIRISGGVETGLKGITINEALPLTCLSTKANDKSCFGVISGAEDENNRMGGEGHFISHYDKEKGDARLYVNSLGEGSIWVTNTNGNFESGDYIASSNLIGYGQKQDSEFLSNYTVAKITMDCNFSPITQEQQCILKDASGNNILDSRNEFQWTNKIDSSGNIMYEKAYRIRYLDNKAIRITEDEYNAKIAASEEAYIAAFVGCTYHCG